MEQGNGDRSDVRLYVLETGLIECTDFAIFSRPRAVAAVDRDREADRT